MIGGVGLEWIKGVFKCGQFTLSRDLFEIFLNDDNETVKKSLGNIYVGV